MRVLLAPGAFKGTFDAVEVAEAWAEALAGAPSLQVELRPLTDGGDGFLPVVRRARPAVLEVAARVPGPQGDGVVALWGWDPDARWAVLESAAAVGLRTLGPGKRRPRSATSAGLGRLVRLVAGLGVRRVTIGLGGSATVDGGWGMARELGFRFQDGRGRALTAPAGLARLARIVPPAARVLPSATRVTALADVRSPLLGPAGAAARFGPQKGARPAAVRRLEAGLARLAERWVEDLGAPEDLGGWAGAGAAGGLGAGCVAFLGAGLAPGAAWCARLVGLAAAVGAADAVVTGEGRWDAQSLAGKATGDVVARARRAGLPVAVVCAEASEDAAVSGPLVVDARSHGLTGPLGRPELQRLVRIAVRRLRT